MPPPSPTTAPLLALENVGREPRALVKAASEHLAVPASPMQPSLREVQTLGPAFVDVLEDDSAQKELAADGTHCAALQASQVSAHMTVHEEKLDMPLKATPQVSGISAITGLGPSIQFSERELEVLAAMAAARQMQTEADDRDSQ